MKKTKIFLISFLMLFFTLSSVSAKIEKANKQDVVGVPLDGGLLTILAASGIVYYKTRQKLKSKE